MPAFAVLVGLLALASGWGGGLDRNLQDLRDGLREHSASGEIVIVEIDARSLRTLNQWPWPRRHHAALIDKLAEAGASLIAFDVNFEVGSNPGDDEIFAGALARAGGTVVLPTFQQHGDTASTEPWEALPYAPFRDHVFLGGVNVEADADGLVRRLPLGTFTDGVPRPSMASLLAEAPGDIDRMLEIDYSIDPATIPRLSFVDIISGRFDPAAVVGKRLFVGGTAADMEDRYAVPRHGVLPGVIVQALAAETIMAGGLANSESGWWPLLLALLAVITATTPGATATRSVVALSIGSASVLLLPLAGEAFLTLTFPIAPSLAALSVGAVGALVLQLGGSYYRRSLIDAETGLPNLKAFLACGDSADSQAVCVARIDRFDSLAATLGPDHTAILVQRIATRIARETGQIIYRTDDHSLAWKTNREIEALEHRLRQIAAAIRAPVDAGRLIDVTLGLGCALCDAASTAQENLQQQVANAAFAAERSLRDRHPFLHFAQAKDDETGWHLSLVSELNAAMTAGEVWNAYQPKLDIRTGKICGVETLVRWTHSERGPVGPDRFIPVVEAAGRAGSLTKHVFRQALLDAARWHDQGHSLNVAVNVSATLLGDESFISWLGYELRNSPVTPSAITIEVTESAAFDNVDEAAAALGQWRSLGVAISIDDYGTGQSSLGYLQRLPASELKIDKSFIEKLASDHRDTIMVRSTVALAHQLDMKVVAEGVEDAETLAVLRLLDCDIAQGWLIGRPMSFAQMNVFLAAKQSLLVA